MKACHNNIELYQMVATMNELEDLIGGDSPPPEVPPAGAAEDMQPTGELQSGSDMSQGDDEELEAILAVEKMMAQRSTCLIFNSMESIGHAVNAEVEDAN